MWPGEAAVDLELTHPPEVAKGDCGDSLRREGMMEGDRCGEQEA